jgi:hypothetical protein
VELEFELEVVVVVEVEVEALAVWQELNGNRIYEPLFSSV